MITLRPLLGHIFFCFVSTENHSDIGMVVSVLIIFRIDDLSHDQEELFVYAATDPCLVRFFLCPTYRHH